MRRQWTFLRFKCSFSLANRLLAVLLRRSSPRVLCISRLTGDPILEKAERIIVNPFDSLLMDGRSKDVQHQYYDVDGWADTCKHMVALLDRGSTKVRY